MKHETIKSRVLREYLSGGVSARSLAKRYNYHHTTISRWIIMTGQQGKNKDKLFVKPARIPLMPEEGMPSDVNQLQEALRIARIRIELLEATIDIADEQLGADIRKKAGTRQS